MIKSAPPATNALKDEEMFVSIVPCYTEEAVLSELNGRLVAVLEQVNGSGFENF
jgi:hypothetical protein